MKKIIVAFVILITLVIIVGIIYAKIRIGNIDARINVENSTRVQIGMQINEVLEIMGEPDDRVVSFFDKDDSMLYYTPPFGASSGIYFQYDTDTRVINRIIPYE